MNMHPLWKLYNSMFIIFTMCYATIMSLVVDLKSNEIGIVSNKIIFFYVFIILFSIIWVLLSRKTFNTRYICIGNVINVVLIYFFEMVIAKTYMQPVISIRCKVQLVFLFLCAMQLIIGVVFSPRK